MCVQLYTKSNSAEIHLQYPAENPYATAMRAPTTGNAATADISRTPVCIGRGQNAMAACAATLNAHGTAEAMRPCKHHGQ